MKSAKKSSPSGASEDIQLKPVMPKRSLDLLNRLRYSLIRLLATPQFRPTPPTRCRGRLSTPLPLIGGRARRSKQNASPKCVTCRAGDANAGRPPRGRENGGGPEPLSLHASLSAHA